MRVLFDGYWWVRGPAANRSVQRELILAWQREFPQDEIAVAVRASEAASAELPVGLARVKYRLWPHGLANFVELGSRARAARADITIAHNYTPLIGRSVTFVHDAMFLDRPDWFSRSERWYFAGMLPTARRASLVVTSTRAEASRIERLEPRLAPVVAIGLAAPPAIASAKPRRPAAAIGLAEYALTVGRLNVRKNLETVIAAAGASRTVTPSSPLLIVGSSEHSGIDSRLPGSIETLRRDGTVRFLGRVDDDELAWLYQNAAVCISLSRDEGFGLTPVEAAMFGAPVLVSDIPSHRETVDGYANFVSTEGSIEEVARALDATWRAEPDEVAREAIRVRYSWPAVVYQLRAAILTECPELDS